MVNQAIIQFVWNKKAKIKYRTMIGPKEQGGLDMPDFQITNEALKVVWVRRLSDSNGTASWSHIPLSYLQPVGGLLLLQCNFDLKLLKVGIPIDFYKEALCAWQKINCSTPNTKKQVLNEIVWNNHHIKREGYSIYYKKWHDAGLTKIEDFFQGNRLLTFEEFCSKFKVKTHFLNCFGLCYAVPQKWINILKGNVTKPLEKRSEKDKIPLDKLSCRSATKFFVKSKFVTPTAERRMKEASRKEHTIQLIYSLPSVFGLFLLIGGVPKTEVGSLSIKMK